MKNWDEIKTAYKVALLGTVSAAADSLGIHRATVIRHIDALEETLGQKLFLRHSNGYTPTEIGKDMMRAAQFADHQFSSLDRRIRDHSSQLSGDLIITSIDEASRLLMPAIRDFTIKFPNIKIRYLTGFEIFQLEYGEADIAIRCVQRPGDPNLVVRPFYSIKLGLYASQEYIKRNGLPKTLDEFSNHYFMERHINDPDGPKTKFAQWMEENFPEDRIVFQSQTPFLLQQAVISGICIGFLPDYIAKNNTNLVEVMPRLENWEIPFWLVTHVDMHKSEKVQAFLKILKNYENEL